MRKIEFTLLAFLVATSLLSARGQTAPLDPDTARVCAGVKDAPFPAQDRPSADEAKTLAGCVSQDLYYGFGKTPDAAMARKCAYLEMDAGKTTAFGGKSILMMIYANALGTARNLDLAMKLGCEIGGPDAAGRVHHLQRLKAGNWQGNTFSICDHSSGPYLYEQCAILDDRFDRVARHKKLDAIAEHWNAQQKQAYQSLLHTAFEFFEARAIREINLQSTFSVQEVAFHERELIEQLEKFESGELPQFTAADLKKAEEAMRAKFAETQNKVPHQWGTVTSEGIRKTQPLWLAYRDAWVALGKARYPKVSADSWKTWATQDRAVMLERSLH
ncbi:MAG: hypothetical protein LAP21_01815 [Acidobacteriia bacterium]|nr:hypothetical protein [Terriglobia bacterium]